MGTKTSRNRWLLALVAGLAPLALVGCGGMEPSPQPREEAVKNMAEGLGVPSETDAGDMGMPHMQEVVPGQSGEGSYPGQR